MSTPILNAPQLTIRADADSRIGSGHVMRCLALAQAWRDQGGECVFVGGIESEVLRRRIVLEGCVIINPIARHPDPGDLLAMRRFAEDQRCRQIALDWLVLDGYHFDSDYQQAMREMGWKVLVIDDMAHLPEYRCDLLLNQNIDAYSRNYKGASDTRYLLGTQYALLRREFRAHSPGNREIPQKASNILVTLGGADPDNVTLKVIQALKLLGDNRITARIIVGPGNPHRQSLAQELAGVAFAWELLTAGKDMPLFMEWADVAVSAGGSTCWELAFLGVPFAVTIVAENQERIAIGLAAAGAAVNLGWCHDLQEETLAQILAELMADREARQRLADNGRGLVDGKGAKRVVAAMMDFQLRPAQADDCEAFFRWANDPFTRMVSFSRQNIDWEEHCNWFRARLGDPSCHLLVAVDSVGQRIGQIRFEVSNGTAVISVSLDREFRGLGLGSRLIRQACNRVLAGGDITAIQALIKKDNSASLNAFAKAGFGKVRESEKGEVAAVLMEYLKRDNL